MRFSITIPSYKAVFLEEAIKSVIQQTYTDWELIIVDDCSPEDLKSIVDKVSSDSRIRFYRNETNYGAENLVDNWNRCLEYCNGDYVLCMGDDDMLLSCCLEDFSKLIDKYPELSVYHMRSQIINANGKIIKNLEERPEYESAIDMMTAMWTNNRQQFIGDFLFSKKWLLGNGAYVKFPMAYSSDWATVCKAALGSGGIANCNTFGFLYRENEYSVSRTQNLRKVVLTSAIVKEWYDDLTRDVDTQLNKRTVCFFDKNIRNKIYFLINANPSISNIRFCLKNASYLGVKKRTVMNLCLRAIVKHYIEQ